MEGDDDLVIAQCVKGGKSKQEVVKKEAKAAKNRDNRESDQCLKWERGVQRANWQTRRS